MADVGSWHEPQRCPEIAADVQSLISLRGALRERMQNSPLMQHERFTRQLEDLYRQLARKENP